jgi:hypothetical protein
MRVWGLDDSFIILFSLYVDLDLSLAILLSSSLFIPKCSFFQQFWMYSLLHANTSNISIHLLCASEVTQYTAKRATGMKSLDDVMDRHFSLPKIWR